MQPLESPKRKMQSQLITVGYANIKNSAWLLFNFSFWDDASETVMFPAFVCFVFT